VSGFYKQNKNFLETMLDFPIPNPITNIKAILSEDIDSCEVAEQQPPVPTSRRQGCCHAMLPCNNKYFKYLTTS
jgi:hypothetical protein